MRQSTRYALHFGPYYPPKLRHGARVDDLERGRVRIIGMSDAPIPWPLAKKKKCKPTPVLRGSLVRAVRRESRQAVAHWWRVSQWRVNRWRRAVGAKKNNDGTYRLRQAYSREPYFKRAQRLAQAKARDPERCAKIAASRLGKPRPQHVIEAMRKGRTGLKHSEETRRKMSEAQRRRGAWPPAAGRPWTTQEVQWLKTRPTLEVMRLSGRTKAAISKRRYVLGLTAPPSPKRRPKTPPGATR